MNQRAARIEIGAYVALVMAIGFLTFYALPNRHPFPSQAGDDDGNTVRGREGADKAAGKGSSGAKMETRLRRTRTRPAAGGRQPDSRTLALLLPQSSTVTMQPHVATNASTMATIAMLPSDAQREM